VKMYENAVEKHSLLQFERYYYSRYRH